MCLALPCHANIITALGNQFEDLSDTTVDLQTNLEWLDLTLTQGRSYSDIENDIATAGGTFNLNDAWRIASQHEVYALISSWFGIDFQHGGRFDIFISPSQGIDLIETFIRTFGDTGDAAGDLANSNLDAAPDGTASITGYYNKINPNGKVSAIVVRDEEYVYRGTQTLYNDDVDSIVEFKDVASDYDVYQFAGTYLVRNFEARPQNIPEPATGILILVGITMLISRGPRINVLQNESRLLVR
jgi:hypothetical protein